MKIMVIGSPGAGKTTLIHKIIAATGWPLLSLDHEWHQSDYSESAKIKFRRTQQQFMATHDNWVIDGNYAGSMDLRLAQADMVLWLQVPRVVAIYRILKRSWRFKHDRNTRPDMPANFSEHFDADYREFLSFVWHFKRDNEPELRQQLAHLRVDQQLVVIRSYKDKQRVLTQIKSRLD
ncbi:topology modulation protein [Lacticaseibacillus porcinae]|uniref:topology modulation protein n=1 Tax=Lacticaseibacillus porcinae TaxID=1123687 RepID=UPI000F7B59AD|nr:topology modulation protein [Lacticaseibacillus porcinae]